MYRFDHMCNKVTLILENLASLSPVSFGTAPKRLQMWIVGGVASEQFQFDEGKAMYRPWLQSMNSMCFRNPPSGGAV